MSGWKEEANELHEASVAGYREDEVRKPIQQILVEYDEDRKMYGKVFHHYKNHMDYQLLYPAWDEHRNEKMAVICMCGLSRAKFTIPFKKFKECYIEGTYEGWLAAQDHKKEAAE